MRGLTVIVAGAEPARLEAALKLAATAAALGGRARLFLEDAAVALLRAEPPPDTAALFAACLDLGAAVILCQSGLAAAGLDLRALDPRLEAGGLAGLLGTLEDDRLVAM